MEDYPPILMRRTVHHTLRDAFTHSIKESDYVRHGHAKGVMQLSTADADRLWQGVVEGNLDMYQQVARPLLGHAVLRLPLKVHVAATGTVVQGPIPGNHTLEQAVHALLPSLIGSRALCVLQGVEVGLGERVEQLAPTAYADGILRVCLFLTSAPSNATQVQPALHESDVLARSGKSG